MSVPDSHFDEFTVLLLDDIVDGDRKELLLCPISALKRYLTRTRAVSPRNLVFVCVYVPAEEEGVLKHHLLLA